MQKADVSIVNLRHIPSTTFSIFLVSKVVRIIDTLVSDKVKQTSNHAEIRFRGFLRNVFCNINWLFFGNIRIIFITINKSLTSDSRKETCSLKLLRKGVSTC